MHELSLIENVLDLALEQAQQHGAGRIETITLRVGSLAGVDPDALQFAFEVVKAGSIAEVAQLVIEAVPAECFCAECEATFTAADGCCECPACGTISRELRQGRELQLLSLQLA
jgi:hydrogenase nickel incorporation protein HypA/HybF